jgi:hypothetical protein
MPLLDQSGNICKDPAPASTSILPQALMQPPGIYGASFRQLRSEAKIAAKVHLRELAESAESVAKAIDLVLRSIEGEPGNT